MVNPDLISVESLRPSVTLPSQAFWRVKIWCALPFSFPLAARLEILGEALESSVQLLF